MEKENKQGLPVKYINTPFEFTKSSANLTLLQQDMLIRVSASLQDYVKQYYGSDLKDSDLIPKPLFSDADKAAGIPAVSVLFSEMGIDTNNFYAIDKAADEILNLKKRVPVVDPETNRMYLDYVPIFKRGRVPVGQEHTMACFIINEAVLDYVFDMSHGYVTHPENIALLGTVERMPMIYYLLRHKMANWKRKQVQLTLQELKEYLGMIERNDEDGSIKRIKYPKFSQFVAKVLTPAMDDIERLHNDGEVDVMFVWEPIYRTAKRRGDPACLMFTLVQGDKKKKVAPQQLELFSQQPKPQQPPIQVEEGRALWMEALLELGKDSEYASWCADNVVCHGLRDRKLVLESDAADEFRQGSQFKELDALMRKKLDKGQRAPWFTFTTAL